jgi:ABC-type antimicrobial peptide transport system permease subunit
MSLELVVGGVALFGFAIVVFWLALLILLYVRA